MTHSAIPPPDVPDFLPGEANALNALYRENACAEPPPALDQRILAAARDEVNNTSAVKAKRSRPWWKPWMTATSAIAVAVLGVSVSWRIMDEQERDLRKAMIVEEQSALADKAPTDAAPQSSPAKSAVRKKEALKNETAVAGSLNKSAETGQALVRAQAPESMAAPAPASAPVTELKKSRRAEVDDQQERSEGRSAKDSVAKLADDAATPETWLQHIRDLRMAGRYTDAAQSLARMRVRYPDFVLPDDMK